MVTKYNGIIIEETLDKDKIYFYTNREIFMRKDEALFLKASGLDYISKWTDVSRTKSRLFKLTNGENN